MPEKQRIMFGASEQRFTEMLGERKQVANKKPVDDKIWRTFGQKYAVMFTDLSGFSKHSDHYGIIHFLQVISEAERLFVPLIEECGGLLVKTEGDSMMVLFREPKFAIKCAIAMQCGARLYNRNICSQDSERILLCIGLGFGDLLVIGDADVFGEQVNLASKLGEDIAKPGDILVTEAFLKELDETSDHLFVKCERSEFPAFAYLHE